MPYSGRGPGPLWARAIYSGALVLVVGVLLATGPFWSGPMPGSGLLVTEALGLLLALLGAVAIVYGFRWRRRGFDDAGMAIMAQQRMERIQERVRKDDRHPLSKPK